MNTARILSTATFAAAAAFASFGAYAAPVMPAAGELSAVSNATSMNNDSSFQSTLSRAAVVAEAKQNMPTAGDAYEVTNTPQATVLTRSNVRSEAVMAVRANEIATGNFS